MSKKYPRTFHLPWSKGTTNDDKIASPINSLLNKRIIITEKIDASNTCLERDNCYARTHSKPPAHSSYDILKYIHASNKYLIPENVQLFGEYCFAKHSIYYDELPCYFLLFAVNNNGIFESWDIVKQWAEEMNVATVPVLFDGIVNSELELKKLTNSLMLGKSAYGPEKEGIVVRIYNEFNEDKFSDSVFKQVRANHVQTDEHWMSKEIIKNKLKG